MDMRESYFCKLQKLALSIAKRNPGPHIQQMQEILVQKQQDEQKVDMQLKDKKKQKAIVDMGLENNSHLELGLDLKNIIFERDSLQDELQ